MMVIYFNDDFKLLRLVPDNINDKNEKNDNKNLTIMSYKLFRKKYQIKETEKYNNGILVTDNIVNYEKIIKEDKYDGIEFCPYDQSTCYQKYKWCDAVDVDSGCIFNTKKITIHVLYHGKMLHGKTKEGKLEAEY